MAVDDGPLLVELNSDPEVMRFITGRASTADEVAAEVEAAVGSRWLAFRRDTGEFIGWFGAVPSDTAEEYDVGWRLRRTAWGHGFATEGATALVAALFAEVRVRRVFAQAMFVNERSRRVMERVGLRYVRTFYLSLPDPLPGTELGEVEYELTRGEWVLAVESTRLGADLGRDCVE